MAADSVGLLFRIRADSKEAQDEVKSLRKTFDSESKGIKGALGDAFLKLGADAGFSGEQMSKFKAGGVLALGAITAVAGAATAAGAAIFGLAKKASDAGSEIFEAGQKTNLSAEFLSVLKVQAEQSGSSFGTATAQVTKWGNSLVDAARGNKDLVEHLKRFGIDAATAYRDPEAALKLFIEQFNKLPPSAANNEAAMKLFKDRTGEIIPVLRSFGGDYGALVKKLDASGQIWDAEGSQRADEFGDSLTELQQTASGLGNVFGREVMPSITDAMKAITASAVSNKETFREWGLAVGDAIRGTRVFLDSEGGTILLWLGRITAAMTPILVAAEGLRQLGANARGTKSSTEIEGIEIPEGITGEDAVQYRNNILRDRGLDVPTDRAFTGERAASNLAPADVENEAARKRAEAALKKTQAAAEREAERQAGVVKKLADEFKRLASEIEHFNDSEVEQQIATMRLNSGVETLTGSHRKNAEALLKYNAQQMRMLDFKEQLKKWDEENEQAERELADKRSEAFEAVRAALHSELALLTDENEHLKRINDTILKAEVLGAIDARTAAFLRQLAVVNELVKVPLAPMGVEAVDIPQAPGQENGPMVDPKGLEPPPPDNWTTFGQVVADISRTIGEAVGVAGQTVQNVFQGMATAVSQTVQAFGGLSGVMKHLSDFTKAVVRNIAVTAGISAAFEAAQGVAALALSFFWPSMAMKAKLHFQAAALYGLVSAGAGAISAAIGGPSGGGAAVAGAAYGGSRDARDGANVEGQREDFRSKYFREQAERDRYTQREDRRGESRPIVVQLIADGRELARTTLNAIRDGGDDIRGGFQRALG